MNQSTRLPALGIVVLLGVLACGPREEATEANAEADRSAAPEPTAAPAADSGAVASSGPVRARGELVGAPESGVSGTIEVYEDPSGPRVVVQVKGVKSPGPHGLHLHEHGDCAMR